MRFRKYRIKCFGRYDPKALQCLSFCSLAVFSVLLRTVMT